MYIAAVNSQIVKKNDFDTVFITFLAFNVKLSVSD